MYVFYPISKARGSHARHHRRTGKPNPDYHLFGQRAFVVSWHESLLYLAEPSACKDLGCNDARGKYTDGDKMPAKELIPVR